MWLLKRLKRRGCCGRTALVVCSPCFEPEVSTMKSQRSNREGRSRTDQPEPFIHCHGQWARPSQSTPQEGLAEVFCAASHRRARPTAKRAGPLPSAPRHEPISPYATGPWQSSLQHPRFVLNLFPRFGIRHPPKPLLLRPYPRLNTPTGRHPTKSEVAAPNYTCGVCPCHPTDVATTSGRTPRQLQRTPQS